MADGADLEDLARRYLDLWQDQMSALAADKEFAEALTRLLSSMGLTGAGAAVWGSWPAVVAGMAAAGEARGGDGETGIETDGPKRRGAGPEAGAAAAAAAPDTRGPDLAELESRLAALEERIAALEGAASRRRGKSSKRSGRG